MNWRGWRIIIGSAAAIVAALATWYLGYVQAHPEYLTKLGQHGAKLHHDYRTTALVILAAVAIGTAAAKPLRLLTVSRFDTRRERVKTAMRALPWTVYDTRGGGRLPVRQLGASAWWVFGIPGTKIQWLYRLARERFSPRPQQSHIRWTKGKGVIGLCWAKEGEKIVNTEAFDDVHGNLTQSEWDALDHDERMGLTFEEYEKIKGKYGSVIAVEVKDTGGRVVGVVALDGPPGTHADLTVPEVVEDVTQAAALVAQLMGRA